MRLSDIYCRWSGHIINLKSKPKPKISLCKSEPQSTLASMPFTSKQSTTQFNYSLGNLLNFPSVMTFTLNTLWRAYWEESARNYSSTFTNWLSLVTSWAKLNGNSTIPSIWIWLRFSLTSSTSTSLRTRALSSNCRCFFTSVPTQWRNFWMTISIFWNKRW